MLQRLRRAALLVVFLFVLAYATLFLGLPGLAASLTALLALSALSGLTALLVPLATLTGLPALLAALLLTTLLTVLLHIVCHEHSSSCVRGPAALRKFFPY
jgi:hypothetical protein